MRIRRKSKHKYLSLILIIMLVSISTIFSVLLLDIGLNNERYVYDDNKNGFLKTSSPLDPSDISLNFSDGTDIIALYDTINFTIDTSSFSNVNYTHMQITFADGTNRAYPNMLHIENTNNFTIAYTPEYDVPTGIQYASFMLYNESGELINDHTTQKAFKVVSNYYSADFNEDELYLDELLHAQLTIKNVSLLEINSWAVSIVNSTQSESQNVIKVFPSTTEWFNITIDETDFTEVNKDYYIKVDLEDSNRGTRTTYFSFKILNNDPIIESSTLVFSPSEIFRSTSDNCEISLNVSDRETEAQTLIVYMILTNPLGIESENISLTQDTENTFKANFHIGPGNVIGNYEVDIQAQDENNGITSYITSIIVKNNPPKINGYKINDQEITQGISILYGRELTFTFNVTDIENSIDYITVSLLNEDGDWFNLTRQYSTNMELEIRTADLLTGTWLVYISATDEDGDTTNLISDYGLAPQQIRIIPDTLGVILPWVSLIIGLILGLLIGVALTYRISKARGDSKVKKVKPTKRKTSKRTHKRKSEVSVSEKKSEKKSEEETSEKERKETPAKRKIKRRL
ncbi:MAG: hypothetical protein GF317_08625 [Candidatus Lokiarchaeota archaeon]|nr:hypothetical protein [Candidatus Lokiarchaeota archaeon]MBD3199779.1 hypothetical protein [Candidatus Lokiarchaeota archaeon]